VFRPIDANHPELANGGFEIDANNDDNADGWHYQRHSELVNDSPVQGKRFLRFTAEEDGEIAQALQGMAVSGRTLSVINFSCWAQAEDVRRGLKGERAGIAIHFYDSKRRELAVQAVARWDGSFTWKRIRRQVPIPKQAREMIIRIGLNGAPGTLDLDDLKLTGR